ncbi:MAG: MerR family transcriptional regulator [Pseudomonadota bacterium]
MAEKARDAFRTISEVANWLDVPAHVLRFWESKFPQIKPVKRAGGRRYYRPSDMELIGGIKKLLHDDGLTIRGVQKMIKEDGVKAISALAPPLDMPSQEEAAARRKARRARRQARQAARTKTGQPAERITPPPPPAPPEEDDEAPFTHVEDAELAEDRDNVVQMPGRDDGGDANGADEAEIEIIEQSASETQQEAAPLPQAPEPETSPVAPPPEPAMTEASSDASQTSFALEETETDTSAEPEPVPEPEPEAPPAEASAPKTRPLTPTAPIDINSIDAGDAQRMRTKRLRKFRRLDVGTVFAGGSDEAISRGHDRLQTLRDRLAIDLDRR